MGETKTVSYGNEVELTEGAESLYVHTLQMIEQKNGEETGAPEVVHAQIWQDALVELLEMGDDGIQSNGGVEISRAFLNSLGALRYPYSSQAPYASQRILMLQSTARRLIERTFSEMYSCEQVVERLNRAIQVLRAGIPNTVHEMEIMAEYRAFDRSMERECDSDNVITLFYNYAEDAVHDSHLKNQVTFEGRLASRTNLL